MHFTVLTAVTLPENCGQAINLPATVRINELVAALRRARFGDNAAKDALDSELVETQVRFEQMVEDLVDNRLLPYCENIEDRAYLEFVDCTEECRREYENDGEVMVRLVNGKWLPMYDHQIYNTYEVYEGKVYQRNFGPLHHRKRTKRAKQMKVMKIPFRKQYSDYKEYAEKYGNYEKGDGTDAYGYYLNPNAEWDWFQIGGRWPNRFLVKSNCCTVFSGELSFFLKNEPDAEAPDGYCWVTGARKKDIAWDVMKALFIQREREIYLQCEKWYREGTLPNGSRGLFITDKGVESWGSLLYAKDETLEECLRRKGLSEEYQYPLGTYALLSDDGWTDRYKMGCEGENMNSENERQWDQAVQRYIASLPDDAMLVSVDCHI